MRTEKLCFREKFNEISRKVPVLVVGVVLRFVGYLIIGVSLTYFIWLYFKLFRLSTFSFRNSNDSS